MKTFPRWLLGGLLVLSLAACAPGGEAGDDEDGTATEQNDDGDDD